MPNSFGKEKISALIRCIIFFIFAGISELAAAVTYNLSTGFYPPCTTNWNVSGTTYTCVGSGNVTLAAGDIIIASSTSTIVARGLTLGSNTTIGSASTNINLNLGSDSITSAGPATIYGSLDSSANVTLVNTTVNGSINTPATINLTGGNVTGAVTSTNNGITTSNTTIGGAVTANGNITLTGGSVGGLVTSIGNIITTNGTNLSGGARAQSGMSITGGTISGNFTMTSNNAAIFSGVTMTSGTISGASTVTIQNGSLLGSFSASISINSTSNEITVNNSTVYGNLTAPNYSTVYVTNGGRVYGTCLPSSTPANACGPAPKPPTSSCPTALTAGITGKYFNNMLATGTVVATRSDGPINFDWGQGVPGPTGVNANNFSVNWEGYLRVTQSGNYRFQTNSDDGIRLTVNGELLINQWNDHPVTTHTSSVVVLEAGNAYPIKLEFYENGGYAVAQLLWQTPAGASYVAIPKGSSPAASAGLYECVATPASFAISNNASGITCAAEAVTVTALNASGEAFVPASGTVVTLSTNPATGVWVGGNAYTFSGSESFFTKYLQQTSPTGLAITAVSATATGSSSITFTDAGLKIAANTALAPISTQIAGVNGSAVVRAIRTNTTTGACEAQIGAGTRSVSLAYSCINPMTCIAGQTFTVNSSAIIGNNNGATVSYTPVNLTFNSNGEAPLTLNYSDVGQVRVLGRLALAATGNNPAITLVGSSDPFVVKPHTLTTSAITNLSNITTPGTSNTGAGFIAAGEKFKVLVQARNANGVVTPNFGNESVSEKNNMVLTASVLAYPTGGTLTALTNTGSFAATTPAGTFVNSDVQWNQVGSIRIRPALGDNDYLGSGNIPNYSDGNILAGRFYPDHYAMASSGVVTNSCSSFSYMADARISINYSLQARTATGIVLTNYDNADQAQAYSAVMATAVYSAENSNNGNGNAAFNARVSLPVANWNDGILSINTTAASFGRDVATAAPDGPYTSLQLGVGITDAFDARNLMGLNMNSTSTGTCSGTGCNAIALGSPLNMRYGRLRLDDAFGPESTFLPVKFYTEYWTGSYWAKNINDNCTRILRSAITYPAGNILNPANLTVPLTGGSTTGQYLSTTTTTTEIGFTSGDALHRFSMPTGAATGSFNVNVDLSSYPWLRFDWNQDGNYSDTNLPVARFGFGSYRGHDRIIYWREKFN